MFEAENMADLVGQGRLEIKGPKRPVGRKLLVWAEDDVPLGNAASGVEEYSCRCGNFVSVLCEKNHIFGRRRYRYQIDTIACRPRWANILLFRKDLSKLDP